MILIYKIFDHNGMLIKLIYRNFKQNEIITNIQNQAIVNRNKFILIE